MRNKYILTLCAIAVASMFNPVWAQEDSSAPSQKYTLKRVFKTGDTDRYKITANVNGEARMGGGEQGFPLENQSTTVMGFRVLDVKNGVASLVNEVESVKVVNNGMEMTNEQMGLDLNSLKVTFKLDERCIVHGAPKMNSQPSGQMMMQQMFGGNSNATNMFAVFPEDPVGVGDSWEHEMPNPIAQMMGANAPAELKPILSKYTLESVESLNGRTVLKIKQETEIQVALDQATLKKLSENEPQGGMSPNSMSMTMKGVTYHLVEPTNGRTVKIEGQTSMNMAMSMGEVEGAPAGFGGDFNIEATISNTVTSLAPKAAAPTKPAVTNTKSKTAPSTKPSPKAPAKPKTPAKPKGKGK